MQRMAKKKTAQLADEIFTLDEVSAYLKAGKRTVYRLAQGGNLPAFKLGGTWRFRRSELDRWIASEIASTAHKKNLSR
jgi:excisionase family DNA binding protein